MTRVRKTGRIAFIGAGPGDPELLTRRAMDFLTGAEHVVHDSDVDPALLALLPDGAERSPAEGTPGDVAKVLLSAARSGCAVVRIAAGDPFASEDVVKEIQAVARTAVPFELVPGIPVDSGVPAYAGVPYSWQRTVADLRAGRVDDADWQALAVAPQPLVLTLPYADTGKVRAGLAGAGIAETMPVCVTVAGTTEDQRSAAGTLAEVEQFADELDAADDTIVVLSIGRQVAARERLSWWESRPLYGWRVLVPRTKQQAGEMSSQLRVYGAVPVEVPTIAVEPPRTPAQMERAIKGLVTGRYEWIVFTSTNAVRAVREKFEEFGLDARAFSGVKIACIGDATARAVRDFGINCELVPSGEQSSEGLLADFPPYDEVLDPINRVLLPRADIATETLAAGLIERGWEVDDVTAYRTVRAAPPPAEIRDAIKGGGFDAVLFTSSSTVRNLVGIAGKPNARTIVACIGPKTAETAREFGLRVDVQPETASVLSLIEALAEYARKVRDNEIEMPVPARKKKGRGLR